MLIKDQLCKRVFEFVPSFFPIKKAGSSEIGICMLLCHKDVTMALYSLQSLFFQTGYSLPIYIIDDGTLTESDYHKLEKLHKVTIDKKQEALSKIGKKFPKSPYLLKYLGDDKNHIKKMRLATLLLAPFQKTICLDADILFFQSPAKIEVFRKGKKNYIGALRSSAYESFIQNNVIDFHFRRLLFLHLKLNRYFLVNDGLAFLNMSSINTRTLNKIESAIKFCNSIDYSRTFYADETFRTVLFEMGKSILLHSTDYLNLLHAKEWQKTLPDKTISIHFIGSTKVIFMYQAVKLALRSRLFSKLKTNS